MFADPAIITVDGVEVWMNRVNQDKYSSEYLSRNDFEEYRLNIRNTSYLDKKRQVMVDRHNVELIHTIFPVSPSTLSTVRKSYAVIENQRGDPLADVTDRVLGFVGFLTSANITKLLSFQS